VSERETSRSVAEASRTAASESGRAFSEAGFAQPPTGEPLRAGERGSGAERNERDERATLRPTLRGGDPERSGGEPESSGGSDARRRWSRERTGTDSP